MHWIALPLPAPEPEPQPADVPAQAHGWWALRFTPRVALLEEALLIEASSAARLWGGVPALLQLLQRHRPGPFIAPDGAGSSAAWPSPDDACLAQAPTALQALAQLRLLQAGRPLPCRLPHDLPLRTLTELRPHAAELEHMGCRTWGAVRALPRAGLARRWGAGPMLALDRAWGDVQHLPPWLQAPESFALEAELPALAESADALLWSASRLLDALQSWLQARHQGALALSLGWRHDLRRIDGVDLPAWQYLEVRTAQPVQEMTHLRRLLAERLGRQRLAAPVNRIALKVLQTAPCIGDSASLLPPGPHDTPGEPWHQLQERLSARLGAGRVQGLRLVADHRPEGMQEWHALEGCGAGSGHCASGDVMTAAVPADARAMLWPPWLVQPPRALALQGSRPCLQGPLRLLVGPQRFETAWWEDQGAEQRARVAEMPDVSAAVAAGPARRDYFVAHNATVGHVWIFRDLQGRWFLHGVYG